MSFFSDYILSIITFAPLIGGLSLLLVKEVRVARIIAMCAAVFSFVVSAFLWVGFDPATPGLQFTEVYEWMPQFGIKYIMGVDGLNLLLVMLTTFLTPLVLVSIWHLEGPKQKGFLSLIMVLETGMLGALVAFDLVFFYIFWEVMLIPMYFIIGIWGGKQRIYAATKFVIYTVIGSLLMLAAAIVLYIMHYEATGVYSTSILDLYQVNPELGAQYWLFLAFALAFAIKVPMFPFHTWLPDAHTEAPTAGSVILAGVLLKMGTYGLLRFAIPLFPKAVVVFAPLIMALGVIGIIYGALNAWMQQDAKKMVAFSSVSHLGFVVIGSIALIAGDQQLSPVALTGAVYQMVNHGISTGALFFLVGIIYERRQTRMFKDFGGLAKVMPWFAVMLIIATLSSVGLPGTGGFVGEFLILLGTFQSSPIVGIFACLGVLLGAVYMLTLCRRILFGPITIEENKNLKDLNTREFLYLTPLAFLAIFMGVFPGVFLDKIKPSINHLAANFNHYRLIVEDKTDRDSLRITWNQRQGE
jgi:NADH-quinone oxidoreductase subunit M